MNFGPWKYENHKDIEQLKRIQSAKAIKNSKVIKMDIENGECIISGSAVDPYHATLSGCSCSDFNFRGLPCKHMYKLALESGYLKDLPVYDKKNAEKINFKDAISQYQTLYEAGMISVENYIKIAECFSKLKK